ncbi:MAG: MBL fold metallo-hydrolase [Candidatus Parvarchaeota archaeon]|nr:MBL fold metallo-hydrolase [Candidatus Jingweiarchaeum tengchongense]MCW1304372.1 MBL fold metallo-hydrolase [Candidatus Jingweiarchaeum tengchongense]MCW1305908.1 MBL fold metallo-hydrolase [Candidatus Jingweiarchaeum tengchongense]MCW1310924.1 MBL fold metallo-hydrolase [Candidatus Jingweiarchaeum tengchongense]
MVFIKIIKKGFWIKRKNYERASSNVVLVINGKDIILVDTGNLNEDKEIISALNIEGVRINSINIVINTHYHLDHISNNFLFKNAAIIASGIILKNGEFSKWDGKEMRITKDVSIMKTPGHTRDDCSVIVRSNKGIIAIVGDLIPSKDRINKKDPIAWNNKTLMKNRKRILKIADFIIPGHAPMFKVKKK